MGVFCCPFSAPLESMEPWWRERLLALALHALRSLPTAPQGFCKAEAARTMPDFPLLLWVDHIGA